MHSDENSSPELLTESAAIYSGLSSNELTVHRESGRKPYFDMHPEIQFSVSHSGSWWICAFSDIGVGVDIQLHGMTRRPLELAKRFFHPDEFASVSESDDTDGEFYNIWSRKEAAVKLLGIGIDRNFTSFDASGDVCKILDRKIRLVGFTLPIDARHSAYAACESDFEIEITKLK